VRVIAVVVVFLLIAAGAEAQSPGWTDRSYLSVGADVRVAGGNIADVEHPIDFAEAAVVNTTYQLKPAPGLDVGGGVRVWRNLGIGVGVSYVTKAANGSVDAQVPHPLAFGKPRAVSGVSTLARNETVVNVQMLWMIPAPIGRRWQLAIEGGPSWVSVNQDVVEDVTITQTYPYDTAAYTGVVARRSSQSGIGFNAGIDGTYLYTRHVGVGASAVFTRAHLPLGGSADSPAGGLHLDAGLRLRF
jgi:hypothetical protein